MAAGDYILNLGHLTAMGMPGLGRDDSGQGARPGAVAFVVDAYGPRIIQYCKMMNAVDVGDLVSKPVLVSISNITSGTTTSLVTTGLTADAHDGKIAYVLDDAGAAGAAPETESSIVANNTTTAVTMEAKLPFSVALAANDDVDLISTWQAEDAADGDERRDVLGVVLSTAVSANGYGWVHREGITKVKSKASSALVIGDPIVADAATIGPFGSDAAELWVGNSLVTVTNDVTAPTPIVHITLFALGGVDYNP